MGKLQVVSEMQAIADADSVRRGPPFADAVEREDGRLVAFRNMRRMLSLSLSHTGMALAKLRNPRGANARYVSISRSNFRSGLS